MAKLTKKQKQLLDDRIQMKGQQFLAEEEGRMSALEWLTRAYMGEAVVTYEEKQDDGSFIQKKRPAKDREQFQAAIAALPYQSAKVPAIDPSRALLDNETTVEEVVDNLTAILAKLPENTLETIIEHQEEEKVEVVPDEDGE